MTLPPSLTLSLTLTLTLALTLSLTLSLTLTLSLAPSLTSPYGGRELHPVPNWKSAIASITSSKSDSSKPAPLTIQSVCDSSRSPWK